VLRKGLKTNSNDTIPERTLQLTLISIEMYNVLDGYLSNLPKSPP
jgi:hypothetical protein